MNRGYPPPYTITFDAPPVSPDGMRNCGLCGGNGWHYSVATLRIDGSCTLSSPTTCLGVRRQGQGPRHEKCDITNMITQIAGTVALWVIAISVAALVVGWIGYMVESIADKHMQRIYRSQYEKAMIDIGRNLKDGSWWFSEDTSVQVAMEEFGKMVMSQSLNICMARDTWQKRMKDRQGKTP